MRIFTHVNPDLDALMSVVAARLYYPAARGAEIILKPANWDGAGMDPDDIAVDMEAGGRGMKGEKGDGVVHSCFALIMTKYAPTAECLALAPVIAYVDAQDAHGNAIKYLLPPPSSEARDILDATSLSARVSWLRMIFKGDVTRIVRRLEEEFLGMLDVGRSRLRSEEEANSAELFADGAVALTVDLSVGVTIALFKRGVRLVVFQNKDGVGICREQDETLRMDHPLFRQVVVAAGEEIGNGVGNGKWFAHPAGFVFARGTSKSPASPMQTPSRVNPRDLVRVAVELLAEATQAKVAD